MSLVRIHNFSVSLDGFGTGEGQSLESPFGHAGHRLHPWMFATRFGREMMGQEGGGRGADDAFAAQFVPGIGAEIMGANKFGPPGWQDDADWKGWWGPNPPFHTPTYVLTHRPRPSVEMEGGTTFHFLDASPEEALAVAREGAGGSDVRVGGGVTVVRDFLDASPEEALAVAREGAGGLDVRVGGGVTVVRDFLAAGLVDHAHFAVAPIVLGRGERVWDGLEGLESSYEVESVTTPSGTTHVTFSRS